MSSWYVTNLTTCDWYESERFGRVAKLEGKERFEDVGVNVHVLTPGQPACLYHSETAQEGFLVLFGECLLVVEEEEHPLRPWDYVHCPAGTHHVFVGAGDGPCAILMLGARPEGLALRYPKSEVAEKHGASARETTPNPQEAYAGTARPTPIENQWAELLRGARFPAP